MAIIDKRLSWLYFPIILLATSTTHTVKAFDMLAEANNFLDAPAAPVDISEDNSDDNDRPIPVAAGSTTVNNNKENETDWSDIEYLNDTNGNTMVD